MSTAMRLLAGIVMASLFMGVFITLYSSYSDNSGVIQFRQDAAQMAQTISLLASQDIGAQQPFDITVPDGALLSFENQQVVTTVTATQAYDAGINVSGGPFGPGNYDLMLVRTETGVRVNER